MSRRNILALSVAALLRRGDVTYSEWMHLPRRRDRWERRDVQVLDKSQWAWQAVESKSERRWEILMMVRKKALLHPGALLLFCTGHDALSSPIGMYSRSLSSMPFCSRDAAEPAGSKSIFKGHVPEGRMPGLLPFTTVEFEEPLADTLYDEAIIHG
jgi:hypothetical protein